MLLFAGIFIGPQILTIMRDKTFTTKLNEVEKKAWLSFIALCDNFMGNNRSDDYADKVKAFLKAYDRVQNVP